MKSETVRVFPAVVPKDPLLIVNPPALKTLVPGLKLNAVAVVLTEGV
jgi:hypothetical protein